MVTDTPGVTIVAMLVVVAVEAVNVVVCGDAVTAVDVVVCGDAVTVVVCGDVDIPPSVGEPPESAVGGRAG